MDAVVTRNEVVEPRSLRTAYPGESEEIRQDMN